MSAKPTCPACGSPMLTVSDVGGRGSRADVSIGAREVSLPRVAGVRDLRARRRDDDAWRGADPAGAVVSPRRYANAIEEDRVFVNGVEIHRMKLVQWHEPDHGPPIRTGLPDDYPRSKTATGEVTMTVTRRDAREIDRMLARAVQRSMSPKVPMRKLAGRRAHALDVMWWRRRFGWSVERVQKVEPWLTAQPVDLRPRAITPRAAAAT